MTCPAEKTYSVCQSPSQPQIRVTRAVEVQTDCHASWASGLPIPESTGYLPDRPDVESGNPSPPHHHSGIPENCVRTDSPPLSSVNFSSVNGALSPSYNWQQQSVNTITCTPVAPPHPLSHPDRFASCSIQPTTFRPSRTVISRMNVDGDVNLCPDCYAHFPTVWTMEQVGCKYCGVMIHSSMVVQPGTSPAPFLPPPPPPPMPLDQPRSPGICPLQNPFHNSFRKGKSPQPRGRRQAKTQPPPVQESRCCPLTDSGNITLPCNHSNCSPPPNVGLLSRQPTENSKWERARQDAVASFRYENCGFYKLPMEIIWMIIDLYPRLDYSYMRSIRAEPSIYNDRFEVLRNLISVSRSFRKTLHNIYWETFEIALTYPRRRLPEPGELEPGAECPRFVSRTSELQGLRKTFWFLPDIASCIRTLTFRVDRDPDLMQLFVDCLLALPNLHTLEIAPTSLPLVTLFANAFKHRPQYRSVRKLIAPAGAHPVLQSLPNLEELVCTRGEKPHILLSKVFQAYDSVNTKTSFNCFELIGANWTDMVGKELIRCFPKIQKVAMRKPSVDHLEKLTSLTEISELDLWITDSADAALIKRLKAKAVEILRQSKPRVVCECDDKMDVDYEPPVKEEPGTNVKREPGIKLENEEVMPVGCTCNPPKRILHLKHLVRRHGQWGTPFWGSERIEKIEVSPFED
ncbi:hypothetical protein BJ322DRAFT_1044359 [Thelephora terrestris]|uniref:F-box domain-containing protein n=1 Tax=Thelephora terrestris TaxID=56493 RepID=A0A9P6HLX7_9AGAM|nr:hypothetical protein BJ322DRAFT_1044359 [Thelephora terrestris]